MTREAFERLCFGDYCVAAEPARWYSRPGEPHIARLRGGFEDAFRPVPGRKTHFVADEAGEYDRVFSYANPDDAEHFEFGFGAVQRDGKWSITYDEGFWRATEAAFMRSLIFGSASVAVESVDHKRGVITVR
jgi:hypothetical protein